MKFFFSGLFYIVERKNAAQLGGDRTINELKPVFGR
jgi:hypothetical protein